MNCSSCGAPLVTGAPRCVKCGSAAPTVVAPQQSGFFDAVSRQVSELTQVHPHTAGQIQSVAGTKSKAIYYLLGWILGSLGLHNFYLGYNKVGFWQLLITILSGGALAMISAIWALVDMNNIMKSNAPTDAHGRPLIW